MNATTPSIGAKIQASFDATQTFPKRMKAIITTCRLPDRPNLSDELTAKVAAHNEAVATFLSRCEQSEAELRQAIANASESDEMGEVLAAAESSRTDASLLAQDAVRLWNLKIEIAEKVVAELKVRPAELEVKAEAVVAKVKSQLEKMGCGLEAQPAWLHGNGGAAEHQLDHIARRTNIYSRAALAAVEDARSELEGAQQSVGKSRLGLEEARKVLLQVAKKAIAA